MPPSDPLPPDLAGILETVRAAERLKSTLRSGRTASGRPESVADHTWRLGLLALLLRDHAPDADPLRVLDLVLVHDLGEAVSGDVPAPDQAAARAAGAPGKADAERADLAALVAPLQDALRDRVLALWDEYEAAQTPEARLVKALDKLETVLQHTQGAQPPGFDYGFNLGYGRVHTDAHAAVAALRAAVDAETARLADAAGPG